MGDAPEGVVRDLVAGHADVLGLDVLAVELKGSGARQLVRVVVDRAGGVSVGACQQLSQALSRALDEVDPIGGRYTLEVTSPGVDWPLTDRVAFARVEGRPVVIRRRTSGDRVEEVRGTVVAADASAVEVDASDGAVRVAYDDIVSAAQALPW